MAKKTAKLFVNSSRQALRLQPGSASRGEMPALDADVVMVSPNRFCISEVTRLLPRTSHPSRRVCTSREHRWAAWTR